MGEVCVDGCCWLIRQSFLVSILLSIPLREHDWRGFLFPEASLERDMCMLLLSPRSEPPRHLNSYVLRRPRGKAAPRVISPCRQSEQGEAQGSSYEKPLPGRTRACALRRCVRLHFS